VEEALVALEVVFVAELILLGVMVVDKAVLGLIVITAASPIDVGSVILGRRPNVNFCDILKYFNKKGRV